MPLLRHYDNLNSARFVTFCCYRRQQFLTSIPVIESFLDSLSNIRFKYQLRLLGYVIMPEHLHLVLHPPDGTPLGRVIGEIKAQSASQIVTEKLMVLPDNCRVSKDGRERWAIWQPRCYDHNCRSEEIVVEK